MTIDDNCDHGHHHHYVVGCRSSDGDGDDRNDDEIGSCSVIMIQQ